MPEFCDVALPVPLDTAFTYHIPDGLEPVVGGRVLVPFRQQRMSGIVVDAHNRQPSVKTKDILNVLDVAPVLDDSLMRLARWIADYYLAPLGEVFRTMLPLGAEFKRAIAYRITEEGRLALHQAGMSGSSARSRRTPEEQLTEFRVLDYLGARDTVREESLRAVARVSKTLLSGMGRKKWIVREDFSGVRDATRTVKVAILKSADCKLNENQSLLVDTLAAAGGRVTVEILHTLDVPRSTLGTLIKRGLVEIAEEPEQFSVSGLKARRSPFDFQFNSAQQGALKRIREAVDSRTFSGMLLHGVTGSGKTAVYLAVMRAVLEAGRSAILLVPEIGLTPAMAADLHQVFGNEVAILHSALSDQERAEQWHRIKRGAARIVVGTRSAVFAPVADLALIIVDEEQDSSYKQEETPRYHARDVAVMLSKTLECKNCAIALTHHKRARKMQCHYCGYTAPVPQHCIHCGSEYVYFLGTGSEKLEELLHGLFPEARIGRLDRDTVRGRDDFERLLAGMDAGEIDLLVGTQMIAKGHDIHNVTLVGVVGADMALGMPDFRAAERTFQLLTQVAGRAGRGGTHGKVVLQTYFPDHYAVQFAANHDFAGFYEKELRFRSWMHYPPYSALANVLVRSSKLDDALQW